MKQANYLNELTGLQDVIPEKEYILWSTGHFKSKESIADASEELEAVENAIIRRLKTSDYEEK